MFATEKDKINKEPFDFFTLGHFVFGYITYIVSLAVFVCLGFIHEFFIEISKPYSIIGTILVGIFWEVLENGWIYEKGLKFGDRKDSILNSHVDVLFVVIGGITSSLVMNLPFIPALVISLVIVIVFLAMYDFYAKKLIDNKNE